jgi:hypothetical protein
MKLILKHKDTERLQAEIKRKLSHIRKAGEAKNRPGGFSSPLGLFYVLG